MLISIVTLILKYKLQRSKNLTDLNFVIETFYKMKKVLDETKIVEILSVFENAIDKLKLLRLSIEINNSIQINEINKWVQHSQSNECISNNEIILSKLCNYDINACYETTVKKKDEQNQININLKDQSMEIKKEAPQLALFDQMLVQKKFGISGQKECLKKFFYNNFQLSIGGVMILRQSEFFNNNFLNINNIDNSYVQLIILQQLLNDLTKEIQSEKSYKTFFNNFIIMKLHNSIESELVYKNLIDLKDIKELERVIPEIKHQKIQEIRNLDHQLIKKRREKGNARMDSIYKKNYFQRYQIDKEYRLEKGRLKSFSELSASINLIENEVKNEHQVHNSMVKSIKKQTNLSIEREILLVYNFDNLIEDLDERIRILNNKRSNNLIYFNNMKRDFKKYQHVIEEHKLMMLLKDNELKACMFIIYYWWKYCLKKIIKHS